MNIVKNKYFWLSIMTLLAHSFVEASFPDVRPEHPLYHSVSFAEQNNIIVGYPDGTFRPDDLVNRAEFTKILLNYANINTTGEKYCFPEVTNEWFAEYVCTAQHKNILSGYPDGTFRPGNAINFAEVAKIVVNTLGVGFEESGDNEKWFVPFIGALDTRDAIPTSITDPTQLITRSELTDIIYRLNSFDLRSDNEEAVNVQASVILPQEETETKEDSSIFTIENEVELSFSLLDLLAPKKKSHATLNIDGTEYMLSVEEQVEQYIIEKIADKENTYKVIRKVNKQTFANFSKENCESLNGLWSENSICNLPLD